ncbi:DUF6635 family protein [Rhodospirillum rubrum]|uniref:Uncharacterized protein n=1 Tax=Rhodospirillum rubrum (strain ATCC 11170 / ATH 1.1.1 / DSM 467 / LMG 4362 / NCIMB 8255 / S1) TaxID=269796 RepID=Q2RWD7_RHORT|nr:DUF6635 family protein [Rhodospirillum rubrum]ABC21558.1 conserved hypothetical protein [Rhodospirillum rubrum ATCC 11170]AEO47243.1 hypothetical protein F11_03865 [Rhodospirillum rubrum F11]MBK5953177.1 hypothetical protein [Rhodospirillum rubrum]QXG81227.1 hypothetical protein KUL73_03915 [Rhodospirillum rubrum]HAQ01333.1 hypothetical protein [Rhodospirillum rubrum]
MNTAGEGALTGDGSSTGETTGGGLPLVALSQTSVAAAVDNAAARYLLRRRERVEAFVAETYSLRGSLRLHRHAIGWDVVRAPVNMALAVPQVAVMGAAWGLRKVGQAWKPAGRAADRLGRLTLMLPTDLGRELTFRLFRDFLELPMDDGKGNVTTRDALAAEILAEPQISFLVQAVADEIAKRRDDPTFRARLEGNLAAYVGSRAAAADLVNAFVCAGAGIAVANNLTPGTWGLSTLLAGLVAQKLAVMSFPLGGAIGAAWYGLFPVAVPGIALAASATAVMGAAAVVGAFAGILTDPLQRRLGMHQHRLNRLVDTLETDLRGQPGLPLVLRDHYVARVFDLLDLLVTAHRLAAVR